MGATTAVKILSDDGRNLKVGGYGVVWGGADLTGEHFTPATDLWLDRLTATPMVLYQHGQDSLVKRTVVGRVSSTKPDDIGLWVEAQINSAKQYANAIRRLIKEGVLGWSTGSVPHLVQKTAAGEITSWPVAEISLTPTPAEPRTIWVRELKSLALNDPALRSIAQEAESLAGGTRVNELPDTAFAFIEPGGVQDEDGLTVPRTKRHFHHHDEYGDVQLESLRTAVNEATKAHASPEARAHLLVHLKALQLAVPDDAHTTPWSFGMGPRVKVLAADLDEISESVVSDQKSLGALGYDTNAGNRIQPDRLERLKAARAELDDVIKTADAIERGDDDQERAEWLRLELALLEL